MNKLKSLSKLAIAGVVGATATVGSMLVAPSAQAQPACVGAALNNGNQLTGLPSDLLPNCDGFSAINGDKQISNIVWELNLENSYELELVRVGDIYDVDIDFFHETPAGVVEIGSDPINGLEGFIEYTLTITDPSPDVVFDTVALGQLGDPLGGTYTTIKSIDGTDVLDITGSGTVGPFNLEPLGLKSIVVRDTFDFDAPQEVLAVVNEFTQTTTPEPGTILGLLAVGGLGLGLKKKKQ